MAAVRPLRRAPIRVHGREKACGCGVERGLGCAALLIHEIPLETVAWYVASARQAKRPDMRYRSRNKRLERSAGPSQAPTFCARLSTTPASQAGVPRATGLFSRTSLDRPLIATDRSAAAEWPRHRARARPTSDFAPFYGCKAPWGPLLKVKIVYDKQLATGEGSLACRSVPWPRQGFVATAATSISRVAFRPGPQACRAFKLGRFPSCRGCAEVCRPRCLSRGRVDRGAPMIGRTRPER